MPCKEGQYYEAAIDSCRSCTIPCSLSEAVCKAVGCPLGEFGYKQNPSTTTTLSLATVNYSSSNGIMDEEADTAASILLPVALTTIVVFSVLTVTVTVCFFRRKGYCWYSKPSDSKTSKTVNTSDKHLPTNQECQSCIVKDLERSTCLSDGELQYGPYRLVQWTDARAS